MRFIAEVGQKARAQSFVTIPEVEALRQIGGLESKRLEEKLAVLGAALNEQANILDEWREEVVQLLMRPLVDEDESEVKGDEYDASTLEQDKRERSRWRC